VFHVTQPATLNPESILDSTKKALQVPFDYDVYDVDIMMHINSVFATLNQLGIGPAEGYQIEGADETWDSFIGNDVNLNPVKTYVYLKVRLVFDPPQNSYLVTSIKEQIQEIEWRLSVYREGTMQTAVVVVAPE
jgi:hypothetical protein